MAERDVLYLTHMLDTAERVHAKVKEISVDDFCRDENLRLALAFLIQIIGEAASKVSREYQTAHPAIPWKEVIGIRNKIVHDYLGIDDDMVWEVATDDLPPLMATLEKIIEEEI